MLQDFLNHNLLIVKEDSHITKLEEAAETVAEQLKREPKKIISYTLAALDPNTLATNADFIEVKTIISNHWKTFATNSKDSPITFLRAVMLEGIKSVSEDGDTKFATLIWLTARNIFTHLQIIGQEKEFIADFILSLGEKVESAAANNWAMPSTMRSTAFPRLIVNVNAIPSVAIDKKSLQQGLESASLVTNNDGYYSNHHWYSDTQKKWVSNFVPKTASTIEEVMNKALKEQTDKLVANQTEMKTAIDTLLYQVHQQLENARLMQVQNQKQIQTQMQLQTQMLWWKEACYSESLDASYREQPNGVLQVLLACDYSKYIPTIYPTSVDYFLKEMHRSLVKKGDENLKISDFLTLLEQNKVVLKSLLRESNIENHKISLLNFISGWVWDNYAIHQFKDLVGFPENTEMTLATCTLWLFHDLQALKISNNK